MKEEKLEAAFNNIIVKPIKEHEEKQGNIIVPDTGKEKGVKCKIISVGPGFTSVTGALIKTTLSPGYKVIIPIMGPIKFDFRGEEYYILEENKVLAIIK